MKLTKKEIRVLELATDVCFKVKEKHKDKSIREAAADLFDRLQDFRFNFGQSEVLEDEPE